MKSQVLKLIAICVFAIPCSADDPPVSSEPTPAEARPRDEFFQFDNFRWVITGIAAVFASAFAKSKHKAPERPATTAWLESHSGDAVQEYDPLGGLTLDATDPPKDNEK